MSIFKLASVASHLVHTGEILPRQLEALKYLDEHLKKDPEALQILQEATMIWRTPDDGKPARPSKPEQPKPSPGRPPASDSRGAIGDNGLAVIKHFEQCHTKISGGKVKAYKDPVGIPTIGYGHIKGVHMGMVITLAQAEQMLLDDVKIYEAGVKKYIRVPLTQDQFDALTSFAFNLGVGALQQSTLRKLLNKGNYEAAAREFPKWCKAGGRKLKGLERRRFAERFLFLGKDWTVFKRSDWERYKDM